LTAIKPSTTMLDVAKLGIEATSSMRKVTKQSAGRFAAVLQEVMGNDFLAEDAAVTILSLKVEGSATAAALAWMKTHGVGAMGELPGYWDLAPDVVRAMGVRDVTELMAPLLLPLLRNTPHVNYDSPCRSMTAARIKAVLHVQNIGTWNRYAATREATQSLHRQHRILCRKIEGFSVRLHPVRESVNEVFAWHGTEDSKVNRITRMGLDCTYARDGLYGRGLYFSPLACKAAQYCKTAEGERTVLLCRVVIGDAYLATDGRKGLPPPDREGIDLPYDAVVVQPGPVAAAPGGQQQHPEIVIFDNAKAYAEYIVRFVV